MTTIKFLVIVNVLTPATKDAKTVIISILPAHVLEPQEPNYKQDNYQISELNFSRQLDTRRGSIFKKSPSFFSNSWNVSTRG